MRRYLFAALCLTASAGASARAICTEYGKIAAGFAMQRDQGVQQKNLVDKINAPAAGGLTEDNKKI
jgi:hypothetical protein